jgi:hypothetical protein
MLCTYNNRTLAVRLLVLSAVPPDVMLVNLGPNTCPDYQFCAPCVLDLKWVVGGNKQSSADYVLGSARS